MPTVRNDTIASFHPTHERGDFALHRGEEQTVGWGFSHVHLLCLGFRNAGGIILHVKTTRTATDTPWAGIPLSLSCVPIDGTRESPKPWFASYNWCLQRITSGWHRMCMKWALVHSCTSHAHSIQLPWHLSSTSLQNPWSLHVMYINYIHMKETCCTMAFWSCALNTVLNSWAWNGFYIYAFYTWIS